ncbi:type IV pilin N-terminal domain-containing protein [Methanogenium cariaci]|jgi:archaeal type IV pilus assembly protein PilA
MNQDIIKAGLPDEAVSPIVGVMLMLVVTIIIAAVVSSFAGGLATDDVKAPSVNLECTVVTNPVDRTGLLFEHKGGDEFELCDLKMHLQNRDVQVTVDYDYLFTDMFDDHPNALSTDVKNNKKYFQKICPKGGFGVDKSIRPGDKFMFYADYYRDVGSSDTVTPGFHWKPNNGGGLAAVQNTLCEYKLIDKVSGQTIVAGQFIVP